MYEKARSASVPMDTITRAIKRGTGELEGVTYEAVAYEGYAPCGALSARRRQLGPSVEEKARTGSNMSRDLLARQRTC